MGGCACQRIPPLLFHILQCIAQVPKAKSHTTIRSLKERLSPNFIASCDTVMDMDTLFFPNVFNLALDRDQRNVKISSGPLPVSTQDNGSVIHQAGRSSKATLDNTIKSMSCNKVLSCTPRATKTSRKASPGQTTFGWLSVIICQYQLMFNCREVSQPQPGPN